ncbi:DUF1476 domain-containing protein [uncultured Rhodoblastus sp.]|uniref:DUF1476 domain-containing protein n=1 Tax=uncultured Rhodoblastus sp. TaxID=543037 RepID=UPI0025E02439|nr:DUF1476 domain-containing protein [uncultured Rhodoblastus sp.]
MSTFNGREAAFENKFAHDEELQFKALARANKLLGLWAAQQLGKSGADAEEYARSLVSNDIIAHLQSGILDRVRKDFAAAGVAKSEHQIERHLEEFRAQATKDVKKP